MSGSAAWRGTPWGGEAWKSAACGGRLVEGQHWEVQTGKGQLGEAGARDEEGQRGEAEPGVDQLGEAVQVLRSELDRRARCCPDRC